MTKIGIIVDRYHLKTKMSEFLTYLKTISDVSIYIEEDLLINYSNINFDEDIFFVKGKGDIILSFVKMIENETSIPIINSYHGIWVAFNRFINCIMLEKAGIPIPAYSLNPEEEPPPFKNYIIKNLIDQQNYAFKPKIEKRYRSLKVKDERALNEKGKYNYFFYQKFIRSKWEYKIYRIGEDYFYYKQLPVLVEPDKMKTRRTIEPNPELKKLVIKATNTIDLKIASVDFLKSKKGIYYLTDINSTPNFNYIQNGPVLIGDYIKAQAKR